MDEEDIWDLAVVLCSAATRDMEKVSTRAPLLAYRLKRAGKAVRGWDAEDVAALIRGVDGKGMEALALYLGITKGRPFTMQKVGDHYHVTRQRAQQIIFRGLDDFMSLARAERSRRTRKEKET